MVEQTTGSASSILEMASFDGVLARGRPFGDSAYIHEQMHAAFKRRLAKIGGSVSAARRLLTRLEEAGAEQQYRALGDPLVRRVIQEILAQQRTGRPVVLPFDLCVEVLDTAARCLVNDVVSIPLHGATTDACWLGQESRSAWIWSSEKLDDLTGYAFRKIIEHEFGGPLCDPTPGEIATLQTSAELLSEILPQTSRSALEHTHLIGITPGVGGWERRSSSSQFRVTGAIFLNRKLLKNPWWVAEHLLHESLHQKLYDFRHGHSLLAQDLQETPEKHTEHHSVEGRKMVSLWNSPGVEELNRWDTHRALAAFHVYVHLSLFCTLAERRSAELQDIYGTPDVPSPMTPSRKAFERAHYLAENLHGLCWEELGLAGQWMTEWLTSILDAMNPFPPPPGASLHLLLDRYTREARKVQKRSGAGMADRLGDLLVSEVSTVQAVLASIDAPTEIQELVSSLKPGPEQSKGTAFPDARFRIADTLLRLTPDGYSLNSLQAAAGDPPDEMVRKMVEASSSELAQAGFS
ncbi:hypothetical protein LRS74_28320 [Streptomyces sp. LX-29]|uniref:hypothetical protein n=1 Tax=Streptomyces sp. LX-29 TaxID=2900152 RepID=UPI00240CFC8D|nr:hypothetical protein [Streptomyces sp. LX-29]WFB10502.1 hypothetical protein LRS74_28320 [Streptomyces sp. LX-29]